MITELNRLIEFVEAHLSDDLDVAALASTLGTTEYHLRRMFSSLTGMPLSEYVRRRRMTVAAAEVIAGGPMSLFSLATAPLRPSGGRSGPSTVWPPPTCATTAAPFDHNRNSGFA